jgi:hypothetical protein
MAVQLCFNTRQYLVPEVHFAGKYSDVWEFPQFFPQVWKTLVTDQTSIVPGVLTGWQPDRFQ